MLGTAIQDLVGCLFARKETTNINILPSLNEPSIMNRCCTYGNKLDNGVKVHLHHRLKREQIQTQPNQSDTAATVWISLFI